MRLEIVESHKEYIFEEDRDAQSSHASTLVRLPDGDILAAWFAGSWEKGPDVAIWMSRRHEGVWQRPWIAADTRGVALWNPVLFLDERGRVFLFYKEGATITQWRSLVMVSEDGGMRFSEPRELVPGDIGGRGPVKNKPVTLTGGVIAAPASLEGETWDAFVDLSGDGGRTWEKSALVPLRRVDYHVVDLLHDKRHCYGKGVIQPTLWESEPGAVHMLLRSTSSAIFRSDSADGGRTWCTAYESGLPNNNSGLDVARLPDGGLVLACNPVGNLPCYFKGPRTPLALLYSGDNGARWETLLTLENTQGSFAYPAIVATENELLVTYTWNRARIAFWRVAYSL